MDEIILKIENLHTYFKTELGLVKAVNGVNLSIRKGETLGLVGESGCGKSVTAMSIMGLIPDPPGKIVKGRIYFENQNLVDFNEKEFRDIRGNQISMIFQEPMTSLNPVYRIGTQIVEAIRLHMPLSRHAAESRAQKLLSKVGISDPVKRLREYPHQMSGGMLQRVMIAMALACNPRLIIADEPTTALDVTIQAQILDLMNEIKQGLGGSILLITHDLGVVAEMAQRVAVMYTGQIVEYTSVEELFAQPMHPYTKGLLASIPNIESEVTENRKLNAIPGIVPNLLNLPPGCNFESRCSCSTDRCREQAPSLIEIQPGHLVRCWNYV
jgi:peptide/nickel transport system ATP-binding protein